jgi:hypothetical protein
MSNLTDPESVRIVKDTVRVRKNIDLSAYDKIPKDIIDYAAGLIDADGEIQMDQLSISQAQKGVRCLHYIYEHFGGQIIALPCQKPEKHQIAYEYQTFGAYMRSFLKVIQSSLIIKKREADMVLKDLKSASKIEKAEALKELRALKHIPHDEIPITLVPTDAYFGGFSDGEVTFDTHGKTSQKHGFPQSHRPICDLFQRTFGGNVYFSKPPNNVWKWEIYSFADKFLKRVAPYIVGKKAQVDMILAMKPGEAADIHCKLRELKGNIGFATTKIDRHLAGEGRVYVRPPKALPRGVHCSDKKYIALIKHQKVDYTLGIFETVEEAQAQYEKYKLLVEAEKRGGPKVDLEFNTRESKKVPPPAPDLKLPKCIYLTKANTFQVRWWSEPKKVKQLGTYRTLEEAVAAQNAYIAECNAAAAAAPAPTVAKLPPMIYFKQKLNKPYEAWLRGSEAGQTKQKYVGCYETVEEALAARATAIEEIKRMLATV